MRVKRGTWMIIVAGCGLCAIAGNKEAEAHFLFVRIGPMAEAGRSADVFFSEQAEAGDPRFVDKIAGTKLWVQTRPGEFTTLTVKKGTDRLKALVPSGGSLGVVGVCEYGVLARPNETPMLLRYYPKAFAGTLDDVNALKPREGQELEIVAAFESGRVRLTLLRRGEAVKGALFHAVDSRLNESKLKGGDDGWADWTPPAHGNYSVYVEDIVKTAGEHNGKPYDEIRQFASLAFTWPLERHDADEAAVAQFEKAVASRATWEGFSGFTAKAEGSVDGRKYSGKVKVAKDGSVEVAVDDPVACAWLEDQLGSIVMHRLPEDDRPKAVLRFADRDDEHHPLGRLLAFQGGRFASSYRVKDGQITVVNRHVGKQNMTIKVLDNSEPNAEGKFLPRSYLVHYWDAPSGVLDRVETVTERWSRIKSWDLPLSHTVTTASASGLSVRDVTLSGYEVKSE